MGNSMRNVRTRSKLLMIALFGVLATFFMNCGGGSAFQAISSVNSETFASSGGNGSTTTTPTLIPGPPVDLGPAKSLVGCDNLYAATPNADWGTDLPNEDGAGPFPNGFVNPRQLANTPPTYTTNTAFWTTRENGPGQSILMSGAFTTSAKKARMVPLAAGVKDWQSAVRASSTLVDVTQLQSTGIAFKVPTNFAKGVYAYRIEDTSGAAPLEGVVNAPDISWAQGVPAATSYLETIRHHVYACGAEVGQTLRIFGKNFTANTGVYIQSASKVTTALSILKQDESAISVAVPSNLSAGVYKIWLGGPTADALSSAPYNITFSAAQAPSLQNQTCAGMNGNGSTDNKNTLQNCLNNAQASATDANHLVMVNLPAGNFVISGTLNVPPYIYLNGAGMDSTTITGAGSLPKSWISGGHHFGLSNIKVVGPVTDTILMVDQSGDDGKSGTISLNNASLMLGADYSGGEGAAAHLSGPSVQVLNSYIDSASVKSSINMEFSTSSYIANNTIDAKGGYFNICSSQNVIVENNKIYGAANSQEQGGGPGLSLKFGEYGRSQLDRNIYWSYNDVKDISKWSVPGVTTDGGTIGYYGKVTNVQGAQFSLIYPFSYRWVGNSNNQTLVVSIIAGKGIGQYRFIKNLSGTTVQMDSAFTVDMDSTSVISISQAHHNVIIANNKFTNIRMETILLYGLGRDFLVENNYGFNTGMGIGIAGYGPYQSMNYQSSFNVEVLGNKLGGDHGYYYPSQADVSYATGIYLQNFRGAALSGIMIRGNSVPEPQKLQFTNGWDNITATMMEKNAATYLQPSTSWVVPDANSMLNIRLEGINY